jgi:hypothetical protein
MNAKSGKQNFEKSPRSSELRISSASRTIYRQNMWQVLHTHTPLSNPLVASRAGGGGAVYEVKGGGTEGERNGDRKIEEVYGKEKGRGVRSFLSFFLFTAMTAYIVTKNYY